MANLFGSADETLSKNTGHTNQANLIYAVIPRSTTKFVEVINGWTQTVTEGTYDADGFWYPGTTLTGPTWTLSSTFPVGNSHTVISLWYRDTGAGNGSNGIQAGMYNVGGGVAYSEHFMALDGTSGLAKAQDNSYNAGPTSARDASGKTHIGMAHSHDSTIPAQVGFLRSWASNVWPNSGSNDNETSGSSTFGTTGNNLLDRLEMRTASKWRFRCMFIYNAALSTTDINAILDDPGAVLTYSPSFIPRRSLLGVG